MIIDRNIFNLMRLILAFLVVIQHVTILSGSTNKFVYSSNGYFGIGTLGVWGFFAISGFLLTQSALRIDIKKFLFRRVLRIYPAFWTCLILTSFILHLKANQNIHNTLQGTIKYFISNFSAIIFQKEIPINDFYKYSQEKAMNGSLWTLFPELFIYFVFSISILVHKKYPKFYRHVLLLALILISISIYIQSSYLIKNKIGIFSQALSLLLAFIVGIIWSLYIPNKAKNSKEFLYLNLILFTLSFFTNSLRPIGQMSFCVIVLIIGSYSKIDLLCKIGKKNDISFGIYLYHYPVLQILLGTNELFRQQSNGMKILSTFIVSALFAFASWKIIEKPAIKLGHKYN